MNRHLRQVSILLPLLFAAATVTADDSMERKEDMIKEGMAKEETMEAAMQAAPVTERGEMGPMEMKMEDEKEMGGMNKKDL